MWAAKVLVSEGFLVFLVLCASCDCLNYSFFSCFWFLFFLSVSFFPSLFTFIFSVFYALFIYISLGRINSTVPCLRRVCHVLILKNIFLVMITIFTEGRRFFHFLSVSFLFSFRPFLSILNSLTY